ncbi:phenylacetate-CoA oxygenase subunit PaaC [Rhizobiaceae bacterium n13]|uniref:Phenylacetate-CoA oxygenase subunit PaaC n=1 Tax=Ferirhizobium litorale TaxID=2927786 RepID=A0AAE3QJN5_9HYPH|nr:1,2-phenylacetyl-CoA epoxidase subunit PaaC [Fererhizobium litorale]MDI7862788.1 phenylacetate-CoA oxygenase subunit PaaC [Fererhizobium litorale]MDI7924348.1 phenylacetate-CoA oxygenase subunit PaaC [Fererhizobium litorale]
MAKTLRVNETPLVLYCLRRADDALILGHRLSEWCGHAPMMEEDMALANMALDLIGQARSLYTYAGQVEGEGHTEDDFAYWRDERGYRNALLVEQENDDFARTIMRQFLYASFADLYWQAMVKSKDETLAAVAAKSEKEMAYHVRHTAEWVIRLGDGTDESHERIAKALEYCWPFTGELFEADESEKGLVAEGIAADLSSLRDQWRTNVKAVLDEATLTMPQDGWMQKGGRSGRHSEYLGHLLTELQHVQHTVPGAVW